MFGFKSMVGKFAFWSVVLLVLVVVTGVKSLWNNQNASTHDFYLLAGAVQQRGHVLRHVSGDKRCGAERTD